MTTNSIPDPFYKGKVRDLYQVGDSMLLIVASDRISAFDVVFNEPIEGKGEILTNVSTRWFQHFREGKTISITQNGISDSRPIEIILDFDDHIISDNIEDYPQPFKNYEPFRNRSILAKRTNRIDFECVVRGYLAGSGFKDYQQTGSICGHKLPAGLLQGDKLPSPIFTPATKEEIGQHDQNVSIQYMKDKIGNELTNRLEEISIALFNEASKQMARTGILLCDTKFEFGLLDDRIVLIDEALTPDSSRYWDEAYYKPGETAPGFDKQYIRDYLESTGWNKTPPPPPFPAQVIDKTIGLYREIDRRISLVI
ncbi:MAG: phosphoribosylaminoimidazolesuccinocarboxamide synthase [Leptonema sp. (in: Bacteria)]|nr:phosphoribosylaminoimidazolesuccinocarboxamide synthase [Leptonema sp. (in: bacteria)]